MASNPVAMASNLIAMASNLIDGLQPNIAMASNLVAMASNLAAMASNLAAMASNLFLFCQSDIFIIPSCGLPREGGGQGDPVRRADLHESTRGWSIRQKPDTSAKKQPKEGSNKK